MAVQAGCGPEIVPREKAQMSNRPSSSQYVLKLLSLGIVALFAGEALAQLAPRRAVIERLGLGEGAAVAPRPASDEAPDENRDPADERFPGGATLKTDPEQHRLLKRAQQCVEDGRLDLAAVLWQKVLDEAGDTLMTKDGRSYISLATEVEWTLAKLPLLALATYRVSADGEAQAILAAAAPNSREEALSTVVRRYFLSSHGDDAAYELACLALDRHDFVGASRLLSQILERHPDPSMPRADLLLRLAVATARMGDKTTAESSLTKIVSAPGLRPPSEVVALVKRDVAQAATLASASLSAGSKDWHMLLGNPLRSGHMAALPEEATSRTLSELWVQEYPLGMTAGNAMNPYGGMGLGGIVVFSGRMSNQPNQPQPVSREDLVAAWREKGWLPTPQLLFDGGKVYIKTPDRLVCYSTAALDDQPVWRSLWRNEYQLDGMSQTMAMMAMNYGIQNQVAGTKPKSPAEVLLFGDRVHQSMSIAGDTIYSLEGKAISETSSAQPIPGKSFQWGVTPRRTRSNWLTAYSAAGGKVRWTRTASDEDKEGTTDVGFLAAPVACGNLLLVPVTDGGTIWLFGLNATDGQTVWKSYLCDEPQAGAAPWAPIAIAVEGREAYLTCGCGVIFAVDAVGGTIRWAIRYQRDGKPNTMLRQMYGNQGAPQMDPSGWDDDVVIPYGRALVVLPSDSETMTAIDRRTGEVLWETPRISPFGAAARYCLGVNGRGLIVGGEGVVRRYDIPSGRLVWEKELSGSYGRGCVTADAVYVPVKDSILKLDIEKGRELAQVGVALTSDDPVGNLFSDGEKLWAVGAGRVYAMTTLEHRMKSLAEQVASGDPGAHLNRMRLYVKLKQMDLALADLRGAYAAFKKQLSPDDAAERLFAAMTELKLPQSQPLVAIELLRESFVSTPAVPKLGQTAENGRSNILIAAANAIRQQKLRGGASSLLSVSSLIEGDYISQVATHAVDAAATADDAEALKAAIQSKAPWAQMMAIRALARLTPDAAREVLPPLLEGGDDRVRLAAARALANTGDRSVLTTFVSLLESSDARVRGRSHQALRGLTGQTIIFLPEGKPEDRQVSIDAWKKWVEAEGKTAKLALPLTDQAVQLGRTLLVSQARSLLIELDADRKTRKEIKLPGPAWGCQGLPNGHRLVAIYAQSMVIEYDEDGKEVWRKDGLPGPPYSAQRLEDGTTVVACADMQQIVEISPDGKTTSINVQGRPMSAQRLDNGNTLVALQQGNRVVEVDRAGKIVWEARTGNGPTHAVRLENGNTLVTLMYTRQVAEYDASGKTIVWKSNTNLALTNPYCAQRLPNGRTLVADHQGVREISESGDSVTWQLKQPSTTGLSSF
jgi:outer membrane protein assembly factor BamB